MTDHLQSNPLDRSRPDTLTRARIREKIEKADRDTAALTFAILLIGAVIGLGLGIFTIKLIDHVATVQAEKAQ